jgi:hypothetical protein
MSDRVLQKVISGTSGVIGATGVLTNSLSLSYFIGGTEKSLSSGLYIVLNVFDLLVCIFDALYVAFLLCNGSACGFQKIPFRMSYAVFDVSVESTAFATCLLGVTRWISIRFPFYNVKKRAIVVAITAFLGQEVLRALLRFYFYYIDTPSLDFYVKFDNAVMIVLLTIFVLINSISCILLAWELLTNNKRGQDNPVTVDSMIKSSRRASVTVLIVSAFFLFFNTVFAFSLYMEIFLVGPDEVKLSHSVRLLRIFTVCLAIPLNSAINPLIYFLRRRTMRQHVWELPGRIFGRVPEQRSVRKSTRPPTTSTELRPVQDVGGSEITGHPPA